MKIYIVGSVFSGKSTLAKKLFKANIIVLLEIPTIIMNYRIIKRWIKQRLGIEKCIYNPQYEMLKCMLKWSKDYDLGKDKLKDRISSYQEKVITLRNNKDIDAFLNQCFNQVK